MLINVALLNIVVVVLMVMWCWMKKVNENNNVADRSDSSYVYPANMSPVSMDKLPGPCHCSLDGLSFTESLLIPVAVPGTTSEAEPQTRIQETLGETSSISTVSSGERNQEITVQVIDPIKSETASMVSPTNINPSSYFSISDARDSACGIPQLASALDISISTSTSQSSLDLYLNKHDGESYYRGQKLWKTLPDEIRKKLHGIDDVINLELIPLAEHKNVLIVTYVGVSVGQARSAIGADTGLCHEEYEVRLVQPSMNSEKVDGNDGVGWDRY